MLSDVRECDTDNGGCDHICTDFPGGYNCSCRSGFRTDGNNCTGILHHISIPNEVALNVTESRTSMTVNYFFRCCILPMPGCFT